MNMVEMCSAEAGSCRRCMVKSESRVSFGGSVKVFLEMDVH